MRWIEILESATRMPEKYLIDQDTGLALNLPNQWSESPYLGAVRDSKNGGYMAQVHIPQMVWSDMVSDNPGKWNNAPESFFQPVGNRRPSMIVQFNDPRQAAWFSQEVLYGGDFSTREVIESYFDERYNKSSGEIWRNIKAKAPDFSGEALKSSDEERIFANSEEQKKQVQMQKNASEYEPKMISRIKTHLLDFYTRNKAFAAKKLGKFKSLRELESLIDDVINKLGVEHFVTSAGSVRLKNASDISY
jgi:hypothetical protein